MIATSIDESFPLYRAHTPRWSTEPLSGAGAALHGGRLNRQGVHALYLATSSSTAIAEYQQDGLLMPPCTVISYKASLPRVVDFRGGFEPGLWDPLWQELDCNWRGMALFDGVEPPSWILSDIALSAGFNGILFQSTRSVGGVNLVVYTDTLTTNGTLTIIDPTNLLPRDQSSWR